MSSAHKGVNENTLNSVGPGEMWTSNTKSKMSTAKVAPEISINGEAGKPAPTPTRAKAHLMRSQSDLFRTSIKLRIKRRISLILAHNRTNMFMGVVTLFAMYGEDIKLASFGLEVDNNWAIGVGIAFGLFISELIAMSWCQKDYIFGFFFWLDLISTLSLLPDMPWFLKLVGLDSQIGGATEARAGRAARAGTRAGRIVRLVRLIRIIKLFKLLRQDKNKDIQKLTTAAESMELHPDEHKSEHESPEGEPSQLGKHLSSLITRKVIMGVLCMTIVIPTLQPARIEGLSHISHQLELLEAYDPLMNATNDFTFSSSVFTTLVQNFIETNDNIEDLRKKLVFLRINNVTFFYKDNRVRQLRVSEIEVVETVTHYSRALYDVQDEKRREAKFSIGMTSFLIVMLGSLAMTFSRDISTLVILPIEHMVRCVRLIATDPLSPDIIKQAAQEGTQTKRETQFETKLLDTTLRTIAGLLSLGFGEAGREVIRDNLSHKAGDMDPLVPGKKMNAIFGFCDIRRFTDATECLQEEVMTFVNEIANIVHTQTHFYSGCANKNIGDAFLLVWKLPLKATIHGDTISRDVQSIADQALVAFLKIIAEVNRSPEVLAYSKHPAIVQRMPDFAVRMGFGLHVGWAIEGAIGSKYKIDASYLSPNVNMAARLEAATKQFGSTLLLSGDFHNLLSTKAQKYCRKIDMVTVKGSIKPMALYTYDITNCEPLPEPSSAKAKHHRAHTIGANPAPRAKFSSTMFDTDSDIRGLQKDMPEEFFPIFQRAFDAYIIGDWENANKYLMKCFEMRPDDGPAKALKHVLESHNNKAPSTWKGYRELTEK